MADTTTGCGIGYCTIAEVDAVVECLGDEGYPLVQAVKLGDSGRYQLLYTEDLDDDTLHLVLGLVMGCVWALRHNEQGE